MKLNSYKAGAILVINCFFFCSFNGCNKEIDPGTDGLVKIEPPYSLDELVMGVDLSYLNQVLDKGGSFDGGRNPYQIFREKGANLVRLRLWHHPNWIRTVYGNPQEKLYSNLEDVVLSCKRSQEQGMEICLDIHYSDNWADPGKQQVPAAWKDLDLESLIDSVYSYTFDLLTELKTAGIKPAYIQIGNEINSGLLHPLGSVQTDNWTNLGRLLNAGIQAVREVYPADEPAEVILHIAQPENIRWFFNNLTLAGGVTDFDVIGVSYYPKWSQVGLGAIDGYIRTARNDFKKEMMIMETAYPWTNESADSYPNIFSGSDALPDYEVSPQGQLLFMKDLYQEVIDGGGLGLVYWEPGWISSEMKTQWGTGSAWENCSFFDFQNNNAPLPVFNYMLATYNFD